MRRAVAIIGLVLVISGFVTMVLSIAYNITFLVPVALILAAFIALTYAKRMNTDEPKNSNGTASTTDTHEDTAYWEKDTADSRSLNEHNTDSEEKDDEQQ